MVTYDYLHGTPKTRFCNKFGVHSFKEGAMAGEKKKRPSDELKEHGEKTIAGGEALLGNFQRAFDYMGLVNLTPEVEERFRTTPLEDLTREEMTVLDLLEARAGAYRLIENGQRAIMTGRNMEAQELEASGNVDEAVEVYEGNIEDGFKGPHPYERLRIIYSKRKEYANAIRVCQAYCDLPKDIRDEDQERNKGHFLQHIAKLQIKHQKA
jgi:hypothetical protein